MMYEDELYKLDEQKLKNKVILFEVCFRQTVLSITILGMISYEFWSLCLFLIMCHELDENNDDDEMRVMGLVVVEDFLSLFIESSAEVVNT